MDLPELFMEYICSMTGKSPSTTGAGSEGALTKIFNALPPIIVEQCLGFDDSNGTMALSPLRVMWGPKSSGS